MSDYNLERISALMDGELDDKERELAIDSIEEDLETKQSWQRYHIIGDTLRNTLPSTVQPDLADKLNKMLENEPTILAPKGGFKNSHKKTVSDFTKPLIGLAVAASVTAVAIFGLKDLQPDSPELDSHTPQIVSYGQDSLNNAESALVSTIPTTVRTVKYQPAGSEVEEKHLNSYILNHNQFNSRMGVQGVSPNARLVGHESQR